MNDAKQSDCIKVWIDGKPCDLYGLSLLFSLGTHTDFTLFTEIKGQPDRCLHKITDKTSTRTYVTGDGIGAVVEAIDFRAAEIICHNALEPLNGYAMLASSNFMPIWPIAVSLPMVGGGREMVVGSTPTERLVTTMGRHQSLKDRMPDRILYPWK